MQSNIFLTNTFTGGMNLDTDIMLMEDKQYRYAENIRIVTDNAGTTGVLLNKQSVGNIDTNGYFQTDETVLYCTTIRDYIVVLTVDSQGINCVYRIENYNNPPLEFVVVCRGELGYTTEDNVKIVCHYETSKVCNIYIACDGHMIKTLNILSDKYSPTNVDDNPYVDQYGNILNPDSLDIVPAATLNMLHFVELTTGSLMSGKVQYAYQLYNLYGNTSMISPVSELISLGKGSQPTASTTDYFDVGASQGSDTDVTSSKGVVLSLTFGDNTNSTNFDSIRIFRIFYETNTDDPVIDVIIETDLNPNNTEYQFTDYGLDSLTSYTAEEFNTLVAIFNAATIERHQNRLFAANVTDLTFDVEYDARAYRCDSNGYIILNDGNNSRNISQQLPTDETELLEFYASIDEDHDCVNPYNLLGGESFTPEDGVNNMQYSNITQFGRRLLGGSGPNVSYTFVYQPLILDYYKLGTPSSDAESYWNCDIVSNNRTYSGDLYDLQTGNTWGDKYNIRNKDYTYTSESLLDCYTNAVMEGYFLGYMRDEIYRFGITFYNSKGQASPVHWIGDIRMPFAGDYPAFYVDGETLTGKALGLRFQINNIPDDVVMYEIVRCDRTTTDRTVVMQAAVGNTVHIFSEDDNVVDFLLGDNTAYPRIPFSNVTNCDIRWYETTTDGDIEQNDYLYSDHVNPYHKIFISPEIDVAGEDVVDGLDDCYIESIYSTAPIALTLDTNTSRYPRKYYMTPSQTVEAFSNTRCDMYEYNLGTWVNGNDIRVLTTPCRSERTAIQVGVGKRYVPFDTRSGDSRIDIQFESSLKYPPILEQNALAGLSAYYVSLGDKRYVNYALMNTDDRDDIGGTLNNDYGSCRRGFFQSCIVGQLKSDGDSLDDIQDTDSSFTYSASSSVVTEMTRYTYNPFVNRIVNFKRVNTPYGGNNYSARVNSTYISTASVSSDNVCYVFGGDIYLGVHDHLTSASFPDQSSTDGGASILSNDERVQSFFVDYFPFETTVNLGKQFGQNVSSTVENRRDYVDVYLHNTITGGTVGGYHTQSTPYYAYNDAYQASPTAKVYTSVDEDTDLNQESYYRIRTSNAKTAGETSDSWTTFQQADYLDVDSLYGEITNLKSFRNSLLYFQEDAVGIAAVNERSLITDDNLTQLTLGTGEVLERFDYVSTANGDGIINDPSITDSRNAVYWLDNLKNEICLYQTAVQKISKSTNVQSFLNDNPEAVCHDGIHDAKYNEIQFCFDDKVLVYNELINAFSSFFTYNPDKHAEFSDKLLYLKDNKFQYEYPYAENEMTCNIRFIVNKDLLYTKVFDNVFFGGVFDDIYYSLQTVKFITKSQLATILKNSYNDSYAIDYREDTYRFAIGREENSEDTMSYPGRLRGKYLICDYTIKCDDQHNFMLPYVNTTYRRSLV